MHRQENGKSSRKNLQHVNSNTWRCCSVASIWMVTYLGLMRDVKVRTTLHDCLVFEHESTAQYKYHHMKVLLLNSIHLNCHILRFHLGTWKLERYYVTIWSLKHNMCNPMRHSFSLFILKATDQVKLYNVYTENVIQVTSQGGVGTYPTKSKPIPWPPLEVFHRRYDHC